MIRVLLALVFSVSMVCEFLDIPGYEKLKTMISDTEVLQAEIEEIKDTGIGVDLAGYYKLTEMSGSSAFGTYSSEDLVELETFLGGPICSLECKDDGGVVFDFQGEIVEGSWHSLGSNAFIALNGVDVPCETTGDTIKIEADDVYLIFSRFEPSEVEVSDGESEDGIEENSESSESSEHSANQEGNGESLDKSKIWFASSDIVTKSNDLPNPIVVADNRFCKIAVTGTFESAVDGYDNVYDIAGWCLSISNKTDKVIAVSSLEKYTANDKECEIAFYEEIEPHTTVYTAVEARTYSGDLVLDDLMSINDALLVTDPESKEMLGRFNLVA